MDRKAKGKNHKKIIKNIILLYIITIYLLINNVDIKGEYNQYQVKAAFIFNFPKYIEWPESKLNENDSIFTITIIGSSEVYYYLDNIAKSEKIKGKKIIINKIQKTETEIPDSEIIFLSSPYHHYYKKITENINNKTTLIVGESEECFERGPLICFYEKDGKIRFQIDHQKVKSSLLKVSSHLIQLGKRKSDL